MEHEEIPKQEPLDIEIPLAVHLQTSHFPALFDLSLTQPLDIFFEIKRGIVGDKDPRPLTLSTTGTAFDGACAVSSGALQLIDREDNTLIDLQNIDKANWSSKDCESRPFLTDTYITIPSRYPPVIKVGRTKYDHQMHLGLPLHIKDHLRAGHKYRLQLSAGDLNIQWWAWGSMSELNINNDSTLPPRATGKIVSSGVTHADFSVVASLPTPPALTIKLLPPRPLSSRPSKPATSDTDDNGKEEEKEKEGEEQQQRQQQQQLTPVTQPRVLVTVTNTSSRTITVKSNLQQSYIRSNATHPNGLISPHARVTSAHRPPSIRNFSIIDVTNSPSTSNKFSHIIDTTDSSSFVEEELNPMYISPSAPPDKGDRSARNFTTLEPGVAIERVVEFPEWLVGRMRGRRCVLALRPYGVGWWWGGMEEVFGRKEESEVGIGRGRAEEGPRPPLMLECGDRLVYELPVLEEAEVIEA